MKHKVKLTVIDKKVYPELQRQYCADPQAGACPCYHVWTPSSLSAARNGMTFGTWG